MMDNVVRSFKDAALEANCFNVVVVRDSVEVIGGPQICQYLLQELHNIVKKERAQARGIVLLALERAPEEYSHPQLNGSPASGGTLTPTLQTLDCFSDPLGWNKGSNPEGSNHSEPQKDATRAVNEANVQRTSGPGVEAAWSRGDDVTGGDADVSGDDVTVGGDDVTAEVDAGLHSGRGDAPSLEVRFGDEGSLEGLKAGIQTAGEAILGDATSGRLALVLDSMSTLLQYCSPTKVLAFLEWLRWSGRISTVLLLLHADLHDARTNAAFERLASTVVDVQARPRLDERGSADGRVYVRHKTRKGKVRHEREQFWLEPGAVRFGPVDRASSISKLVAETASASMQSGRAPPHTKPAGTPEVSFSLELSEAEKQSRARVVLPYEHQGDGHEVKIYDGRPSDHANQRSKRTGHIGYEGADEDGRLVESEGLGRNLERGHILYTRDSDEEPPDSDEDPDDDLDI